MSLISKLFIAFQLMDGVTTFIAMTVFAGLFREGNPLVPLIGWAWFIVLKIVIVIGTVLVAEYSEWYTPIKIVTVLGALVVISNSVQLLMVIL